MMAQPLRFFLLASVLIWGPFAAFGVESVAGARLPSDLEPGDRPERPQEDGRTGEKETEDTPRDAPSPKELADSGVDSARKGITALTDSWRALLEATTASGVVAVGAVGTSFLAGGLLLLFGWSLLRTFFVPISALVGAVSGAGMGAGLAMTVAEDSSMPLLVGIGVGVVLGLPLFLTTALKARPICWILLGALPFALLGTLLFPLSPLAACTSLMVGAGVGLFTAMKRRVILIISTSVLGALCMTFCWGVTTYTLDKEPLTKAFDSALQHPFLLLLGVALLAFVGADFQLVLGLADTEGEKHESQRV